MYESIRWKGKCCKEQADKGIKDQEHKKRQQRVGEGIDQNHCSVNWVYIRVSCGN